MVVMFLKSLRCKRSKRCCGFSWCSVSLLGLPKRLIYGSNRWNFKKIITLRHGGTYSVIVKPRLNTDNVLPGAEMKCFSQLSDIKYIVSLSENLGVS